MQCEGNLGMDLILGYRRVNGKPEDPPGVFSPNTCSFFKKMFNKFGTRHCTRTRLQSSEANSLANFQGYADAWEVLNSPVAGSIPDNTT